MLADPGKVSVVHPSQQHLEPLEFFNAGYAVALRIAVNRQKWDVAAAAERAEWPIVGQRPECAPDDQKMLGGVDAVGERLWLNPVLLRRLGEPFRRPAPFEGPTQSTR